MTAARDRLREGDRVLIVGTVEGTLEDGRVRVRIGIENCWAETYIETSKLTPLDALEQAERERDRYANNALLFSQDVIRERQRAEQVEARLVRLVAALEAAKMRHQGECPLDLQSGLPCNCDAAAQHAEIDAALAALRGA